VKTVKLPTVWCGYHGVFKNPTAASIAVMKRYTDVFSVIAMPHSGQEYKASPDQIKTDLYRGLIDGGADVVIGDHPHWVQNSESYKGHLIVYSLGNFIFDQQDTAEVTRSAMLEMTLSVAASAAPDLDKWIALADNCGSYSDQCLKTATNQKLTKLPITFHFAVQGSNDSGKIVKPATTEQLASIKQRLNWATTIQGLTGSYSGE
jgi:poly-gamma-glutamate synthesis protein (capsule biosynthesis protein)